MRLTGLTSLPYFHKFRALVMCSHTYAASVWLITAGKRPFYPGFPGKTCPSWVTRDTVDDNGIVGEPVLELSAVFKKMIFFVHKRFQVVFIFPAIF